MAGIYEMISGLGRSFGDSYASARKDAEEAETPQRLEDLLTAVQGARGGAAPSADGGFIDKLQSAYRNGGSGSAVPFKTDDPVAEGLQPHQKALLNGIAGPESNGRYNVRYTPQGGALFEGYGQHPGIAAMGPDGPSTAAGRYQFTKTTWDDMGGGDFSPANQDRRALQLAAQDYRSRTGRDLDADLKAEGFSPRIQTALGPTWIGLKTNQGRNAATFAESLNRYGATGGGPSGLPTRVAGMNHDAANIPVPGAQPAAFAIPEGASQDATQAAAPAQATAGLGGGRSQLTPELRTALTNAWKNPNTRAVATQVFSSFLTGRDTSWSIQDLGNGRKVLFDAKSARMVPLDGTGDSFSTERDQDGNLLQVNAATGKREMLRAAPEQRFTYQNMDGIGMVALHPSDPSQSRVIIAGQQPRPLTDEEFAKFRIPEGTGGGMGADGKPFTLGGTGKTVVNVDTKGAGKFAEKANELQAKRYGEIVEAGDRAVSLRADIDTMAELGSQIATGKLAGARLGLAQYAQAVGLGAVADGLTNGKMGEMEAYTALADKLTPQMRVPGSGATSDKEGVSFRNSLPSLLRSPEGNAIVVDTFRGMADYQALAGEIAGRALRGEISQSEADQAIKALPSPYARFKEFQSAQSSSSSVPRFEPGKTKISPEDGVALKSAPDTAESRQVFDARYGEGAAMSVLRRPLPSGPAASAEAPPAAAPSAPKTIARGSSQQTMPQGYTKSRMLFEARKAIRDGRDRSVIEDRLRGYGIDPKGLGN